MEVFETNHAIEVVNAIGFVLQAREKHYLVIDKSTDEVIGCCAESYKDALDPDIVRFQEVEYSKCSFHNG